VQFLAEKEMLDGFMQTEMDQMETVNHLEGMRTTIGEGAAEGTSTVEEDLIRSAQQQVREG
jgi:hypothetical protein